MHQQPVVTLGLVAVSLACAAARQATSDVDARPEPAVAALAPQSNVARAQPNTLGEVVQQLSDSIWINFQDQSGAHWFGSDGQGLYRFDGKTLTHFTTKHGLCHDEVRGIQQHAPTGDILIGTNGGVSKFDGERFVTLPMVETSTEDEGWVLDPDDVWIQGRSGPNGPCRYDGKTLHALRLPKSPHADEWYASSANSPWKPYEVWTVYKDRKGQMWFGTACMGACRFDGKTREWLYEAHHTQLPGDALFGLRSIVEDQRGDYWFCNTQFRYAMRPRGEAYAAPGTIAYTRKPGIDLTGTIFGDEFFYFQSIVDDEHGNLWMAPYAGGVRKYDGKTVTYYPMKDAAKNEITMFSIYRDRRGDLWVGTHKNGAYKFNGTSFERFKL